MNEIIILLLVMWGDWLYVQSSMRRLKEIVEKYKQKQRINLKEEKKKILEESYIGFWKENKIKLGAKVFFSFGYATFVISYPIVSNSLIWLSNFWLLTIIVVLVIMQFVFLGFIISFITKKIAKFQNSIKKNNHIFVIIFQPVVIILLFISVICINEVFFKLELIIPLIKYGLVFVNIVTIQDIQNVFEDLVEKTCIKIENRYSK